MRKIEVTDSSDWMIGIIEAMQMCPLPESPYGGFNKVGYLHELSGSSLSTEMALNLLSLSSGNNMPFKVDQTSLVIVFVEVSEEIEVALSISESGGMRKTVALSSD